MRLCCTKYLHEAASRATTYTPLVTRVHSCSHPFPPARPPPIPLADAGCGVLDPSEEPGVRGCQGSVYLRRFRIPGTVTLQLQENLGPPGEDHGHFSSSSLSLLLRSSALRAGVVAVPWNLNQSAFFFRGLLQKIKR